MAVCAGAVAWSWYRRRKNYYDDHSDSAIPNGNGGLLSAEETDLVKRLQNLDQNHIFEDWPPLGVQDQEKRHMLQQLTALDSNYPGGLSAYISSAKKLLSDAQAGKNPFEGFTPEVPDGKRLDYGSKEFSDLENIGIWAAEHAAFVLVAGGLGERLGFSGIKVALPTDSARGACFLQVYIESILALQNKHGCGCKLRLAIMTSADTHERTQDLLRSNKHFGMQPDQVTLLKQEKVACLSDSEAHLALDPKDSFAIQTKPHGHGDVHALLHTSGLLKTWQKAGVKWVAFFQDTNGLVFRALPAALGVSSVLDLDVNSLAVPRAAKEAIGGITRLTNAATGRAMTINVEYNQLDPLLRGTGHAEGDVADSSGFSPYPGNINQLILKLQPYAATLQRTGGRIAEFINPKYKDESKTAFKSSTRLECMMQDIPRELPDNSNVGFTVINQVWAAYSPVKNSPEDARAKASAGGPSHSATTGELDIYQANCRTLQMLGATIEGPESRSFNGLDVQLWPRVSWSPLFALTIADLQEKINAKRLHLAHNGVLVIGGEDISIESLHVEGALVVDAVPGARLTINGLHVQNDGWRWMGLKPNKPMTEDMAIRGFKVCKHGTLHLQYDKPGRYVEPAQKGSMHESSETAQEREAVAA